MSEACDTTEVEDAMEVDTLTTRIEDSDDEDTLLLSSSRRGSAAESSPYNPPPSPVSF